MDPIAELAAASLAFVGTHFAMSHPLRAPMVKALGAGGAPRFHKVLAGQIFKTALEADDAAVGELARLNGVSDDAELIW